MKQPLHEDIVLQKIVGEGKALGQLADGRKAFIWGGLPGERVTIMTTKTKRNFVEGIVVNVIEPSDQREEPRDQGSYLSTSPWQIFAFDAEQHYKSSLIEEAFELHNIVLPGPITVKTDHQIYSYRNKVEFSFYWDNDTEQIELSFFQRGTKGKIPVHGTSLAIEIINETARAILEILRTSTIEARNLKTLMIRCSQSGQVSAQLYLKDKAAAELIDLEQIKRLAIQGFELIHSDYRSPASVITERLATVGSTALRDSVLGVPFRYATEGFFQVNIPVYEMALVDMKAWIKPGTEVIDMYSGVGTIGLTIGGEKPTLVEINDSAVDEMRRNVAASNRKANIIHTASETALEYIRSDQTVILDPPRAGLHERVIERLLEVRPPRIIYLSCNPVTQARDVAMLSEAYGIEFHQGYNFFPRTPHIEHLLALSLR